jgi:hypothetical protein
MEGAVDGADTNLIVRCPVGQNRKKAWGTGQWPQSLEPIMDTIRQQHPKAIGGGIDGEEIFILMSNKKRGKPDHWDRWIADQNFMTLLRVYDSGNQEAFDMLDGFKVALLAPQLVGKALKE